MGYSVAARASDKATLRRMIAFMEEHYREPHEVFGREHDYSRLAHNLGPKAERLSYDSNRLSLGFDYNACEPERDYIFAVVRWMALKMGALKKFKEVGEVPYVAYDGGRCAGDRWPVLTKKAWGRKVPECWAWTVTDSVGFKSLRRYREGCPAYDELETKAARDKYIRDMSRAYKELYGYSFEEIDKILLRELRRLDRLWKRSS